MKPFTHDRCFGVWFFGLVLALTSSLLAQNGSEIPRRDFGYGLFGVGGFTDGGRVLGQAAIGGEALIKGGLGVGADIGLLFPFQGESAFGMFSPSLYYRFRRPGQKVEPFVTGGYTLLFHPSVSRSFANAGGGVNLWLGPRWGIKLEGRAHFRQAESLVQFRAAFLF